ncbi:1940_t:CDS:1, partial [Racocetra persica]
YEENGEKKYESHPSSPLTYYNFDLVGIECPEIGLDYEEQEPSS